MSTPTPRTEAEYARYPVLDTQSGRNAVLIEFPRTLETELTTALARVAQLEQESAKWRINWRGLRDAVLREDNSPVVNFASVELEANRLHERNDSLTRQLSESQAQLAEANARLQKGPRGEDKIDELESCIGFKDSAIAELSAQLASAREDSARLDWLNQCNVGLFVDYYNRSFNEVRSAIDSARGVTSCDRCDGQCVIPAKNP